MGIYEVIKNLCDKNGISVTALEAKLGFGRGSIGKMRSSQPSIKRIQKIADYFGVSVDYLMGDDNVQNQGQDGYYTNPETAKIAQEIFETPGYRILFDAARDSKPEDLQMAADLLRRLKGENSNDPC